jgi:putative tricarboxylic transport membrane protein
MGGHVTAGISGYNEFAGQIKSGKLKALALSSAERLPGVDIPTLKELGINVELINWRGIFGAPGITDAQTKALIDVLDKTVKTPAWQETLTRNQWADLYLAGDAFKTFLDADTARITKVMDGLGLGKK